MSYRQPKVHVRECEATGLGLKLAYQVKAGQFHEALGTLRYFIKAKIAGASDFLEYATADELPIGLAPDLRSQDMAALEDNGLDTVGAICRLTDEQLRALPGLDTRRVEALRAAVAELKREYRAYRRTLAKREGGQVNSS